MKFFHENYDYRPNDEIDAPMPQVSNNLTFLYCLKPLTIFILKGKKLPKGLPLGQPKFYSL